MAEKEKARLRRNTSQESRPLIPSHILDEATQRLFVLSLFVLIQSWKLYDVTLLKSNALAEYALTPLNNFSFVLKYAIIDGLFLWLLPVLSIQYLIFSPLKTLLFALLLNGVTFFLVSSVPGPLLGSIFMPLWKLVFQNRELTIVGDSIDLNSVVDMDSHFKGKLTIHYLPDSSARMNPFHFDQLCLDPNQILEMPVEFNTTTDIGYLQIEHTAVNNEIKNVDFKGHSLRRLLRGDYRYLSKYPEFKRGDDRVFYISFPISEPGSYKIKSVTDSKGLSIRTYKSEFLISSCPRAQFSYPPNFDDSKNYRCINSKQDEDSLHMPLVESFGVTPVSVLISSSLNGKFYKEFNVTIGDKTTSSSSKDISWLKAYQISRNTLEQEISKDSDFFSVAGEGILKFQLIEIRDYLGNTKRYNPLSDEKDIRFEYELKRGPKLQIVDSDSVTELLLDDKKTIKILGTESLKETDFPLSVTIVHLLNTATNITKEFTKRSDLDHGIQISQPGIYQLLEAKTRYCDCELVGQAVNITVAQPPTVDINATPISDKCLGTVGYTFDLDLSGKPPFQVQYHIYTRQSNGILRPVHSSNGKSSRLIRTLEKRHSFTFRPPAEGNYVVVFNNLKDLNYNQRPVVLDESRFTYSTYFKKPSRVSFFAGNAQQKTINTCFGERAKIPLYFEGNGPFTFNYDFVDVRTGQKLVNTVTIEDISSYEIEVPESIKGGKYEIKLSNITDKAGCNAILDERERIIINSRTDIPEVQINNEVSHFQIVEGDSVEIPIKIKSSVGRTNNDKIEYDFIDLFDKTKRTRRSLQGNRPLRVNAAGEYSLANFENGGCSGKVIGQDKKITVSYYDRPRLVVSSPKEMKQHKDDSALHLQPICQDCKNQVQITLEGTVPFVVDYEIRYPNGRVETRSMNVASRQLMIDLPTAHSGRYEYAFKGIYDNLYTKEKVRNFHQKLPRVFYDVNPLPSLEFDQELQISQLCENRVRPGKPLVKIPIQLSGSFPFKINATLTHAATGLKETLIFSKVTENSIVVNGNKSIKVGEHILTINEVTDGNGCSKKDFLPSNNYIIAITEVPNIFNSYPSQQHYCVGDHIAFKLTGVSPYTVYYNFNEKLQKAEVPFLFSRLASKPGFLTIDAVQDSSASSCLVNFTALGSPREDLKLQVHDLPSVEVNKGDYIVEDLHEGEQTELIFRFFGVPPFSVTYVRTTELNDKKSKKKAEARKIIETHTIDNIMEYEYTVLASLEGTYEAIVISDAYCTARRSLE
ncbi:hypothetical protein G9P44_001051 [Scheffersomyces stipitis]|nr:hypothetical protein G9P44_001051 [Scheffersomyces stipitis]